MRRSASLECSSRTAHAMRFSPFSPAAAASWPSSRAWGSYPSTSSSRPAIASRRTSPAAPSSGSEKLQNPRSSPRLPELQKADRYRKVEAPGSGAARIDVQDAPARGNDGTVGVSGNHHIDAFLRRIEVELLHIVQHEDAGPSELDAQRGWGRACPGIATIVIPPHGVDRCEGAQLLEHGSRADVSGMNDAIDACERLLRLRAQQSVRV